MSAAAPDVPPGPARGGARLEVVNPATAEVIRTLAEDGPEAVARKVERARRAQPDWAATPLGARKEAIARFARLVLERKDELARTLTSEMGKPIRESRGELGGLQGRIDFFLANVARATADEVVHQGGGLEERITQEPLGLVANVSAWNYPYFVGSNVFVPALLTGNAVLYKPSEHAPLTGLLIAELLHDAGVPPEVFQTVIGGGAAGAALLDQAVDAVCFTGSRDTGLKVAEAAARRLLRVQLELGGKDPLYVTDDVDVDRAAQAAAEGTFYNNGQSCCAVERIYVHASVYEAFVDALVARARALAMGDPQDEATDLGPIAREAQIPVLEGQVRDATSRGARVMTGGRRAERRGFYFEPTVLVDVTHGMAVMKEETFGPVVGVAKVEGDDEALRLMNDTEYGLTAAVFCRDRDRASRLLAAARTGTAYWNCCDRVSPRLPWSGRGQSGLGSTLGMAGLRAFVQPKAWHLRSPR